MILFFATKQKKYIGVMLMNIKYVDGHYEIVSADSGQFIQSADTWDEALDDMKELLQTA